MSFLKDHIGRRLSAPPAADPSSSGASVPSTDTETVSNHAACVITKFLRACHLRRREVTRWVLSACATSSNDASIPLQTPWAAAFPFVHLTHFALLRARHYRLLLRVTDKDGEENCLHAAVAHLFDRIASEMSTMHQEKNATMPDAIAFAGVTRHVLEVCAVVFYTHAMVSMAVSASVPGRVLGFVNSAFLKSIQVALALFDPSRALWFPQAEQRAHAAVLLDALLACDARTMPPPSQLWPLLSPSTLRGLTALRNRLPAPSPLGHRSRHATPGMPPSCTTTGCCVAVDVPFLVVVRACFIDLFAACPVVRGGAGVEAHSQSPRRATPAAVCAKALLTLLRQIHQCLLQQSDATASRDGAAAAAEGVATSTELAVSVTALRGRLLLVDQLLVPLSSAISSNVAVHHHRSPVFGPFIGSLSPRGCSLGRTAKTCDDDAGALRRSLAEQLACDGAATTALSAVYARAREAYMAQWLAQTEATDAATTGSPPGATRLVVHKNPFEREGQLFVRLSVAHLLVRVARQPTVAAPHPVHEAADLVRLCEAARRHWRSPLAETRPGAEEGPDAAEAHLLSTVHTSRAPRAPAAYTFTQVDGEAGLWVETLAALVELSVGLWRTALGAESSDAALTSAPTTLCALRGDWLDGPLCAWGLRAGALSTMALPQTVETGVRPTEDAFFSTAVRRSVVERLGRLAAQLEAAALRDGLLPCFRVLWDSPTALLLSTPLDSPSFGAALSAEEQRRMASVVATRQPHCGSDPLVCTVTDPTAAVVTPASPPPSPPPTEQTQKARGARRPAEASGHGALQTVLQLAARLGETFHFRSREPDLTRDAEEAATLQACQTRFTDRAHAVTASLHGRAATSRAGAADHGAAMTTLAQLRDFSPPMWLPFAAFLLRLSNAGVRAIGVCYLLHGGASIAGFFHHCCAQPEDVPDTPSTGQLQLTTETMPGSVVVYPPIGSSVPSLFASPSSSSSLSASSRATACDWLSLLHAPSTPRLLEAYTAVFAPSSDSSLPAVWPVCWPAVQALHVVQVAYSTLGSMLVNVLMLQDDAGLRQGAVLPLAVLRTVTYLSNFYVVTRILAMDAATASSPTPPARSAQSGVNWRRVVYTLEQQDSYATGRHFAQTLKLLSQRSVRVDGLAHLLSTFAPHVGDACTERKLADGDAIAVQCLFALPHLFPFSTRVAVLRARIKQYAAQYSTSAVHVYRTFTGQTVAFRVPEKFRLRIRRSHVLDDALEQVRQARTTMAGSQLLYSTWHVTFIGPGGVVEAGVDVGGLFKEFWELCVEALLEPNRGLFVPTASEDGGQEDLVLAGRLYPNPHAAAVVGSDAGADALFAFTGLLLAKGISEGLVMQNTFATFFLSNVIGNGVCLEDLADLDPVEYRSLLRLRGMANVEDACLFFAYEDEWLGTRLTCDLVPNGSHIPVTNDNVVRYLHLYAQFRLVGSLRPATEAFRQGLMMLLATPTATSAIDDHGVTASSRASAELPDGLRLLQLFSAIEVRQLFSGAETDGAKSAFDVADLEQHTVCNGANHRAVRYLFAVLRELSPPDQGLFLRFCTGSSRPPLMGFRAMQPPFTITGGDAGDAPHAEGTRSAGPLAFIGRLFQSDSSSSSTSRHGARPTARLPTASTCFNLLHLPAYGSKEVLKERLLVAIRADSGFGLS